MSEFLNNLAVQIMAAESAWIATSLLGIAAILAALAAWGLVLVAFAVCKIKMPKWAKQGAKWVLSWSALGIGVIVGSPLIALAGIGYATYRGWKWIRR